MPRRQSSKQKEEEMKEPTLLEKLKLDKHHRMERFGVSFATVSGILFLSLVMNGVHAHKVESQMLSDKAVYTKQADFSKSGIEATTAGVFVSPDKKTAYLLLQFADMRNLSLNPNKYVAYITGYNQKLKHMHMVGSVVVLGSSGYLGVTLTDAEGFANQILDITLRSTTELDDYSQHAPSGNYDNADPSFKKYDQLRFYANPGASKATVVPALSNKKLSPEKLYYSFVGKLQEKDLLKELATTRAEIKRTRQRITEYTTRLKDAGFAKIDAPEWTRDDYTLDEGFDFDTSNVGLNKKKTYLDVAFKGDLDRYKLKAKTIQTDQNNVLNQLRDENPKPMTLTYENGEVLDLSTVADGVSSTKEVTALRDFNELTQAWDELLTDLSNEQYTLANKLLALEQTMLDQSDAMKFGSNKKVIMYNF